MARLAAAAFSLAAHATLAYHHTAPVVTARPLPPGPLNIAYPSGGECDAKVIDAVTSGLNVVIWSFINLGSDSQGNPTILLDQAPDFDCVANLANEMKARNLNTTHMISIGGWGSPHPAITNNPQAVYQSWKDWNEKVVARNGWPGFDGMDWDLEGVNDPTGVDNHFTVGCLDTVGIMSQLAKADGYIVSLVPPESYLDITTSQFDLNLTHNYPSYPSFYYHAHNPYAYIYSKYDGANTFDFISIQLYESYSHALYNITALGQPASAYLANYIPQVYAGWTVDFSSAPEVNWPTQHVSILQSQLVIGLANGWTDGTRALLVWPVDVGVAYKQLAASGLQPRGFMFWDIGDEGDTPPGYAQPLYMAAGLNAFLHTRP